MDLSYLLASLVIISDGLDEVHGTGSSPFRDIPFMNLPVHHRNHKSSSFESVLTSFNPVHIFPHYFSKTHFYKLTFIRPGLSSSLIL